MNIQVHATWLDWPETKSLVAAFAENPSTFRFVGGAVRDALLGRQVHDVDAATTLLPEAVMHKLADAQIQAIPTGLKHGTVTARIGERTYEITTLRRDMSCDGRHAEVSFTNDWREDALRRDFTMNALYMTPSGLLYDYTGGLDDARSGMVRFIGDPAARVREDRLRILRFFRFFVHYGKGELDAAGALACRQEAAGLAQISGERIQTEMLKLFAAPGASKTLSAMISLGVLEHAIGFSPRDAAIHMRLDAIEELGIASIGAEVKLCGLCLMSDVPPDAALKALATRLRLPGRIEKKAEVWVGYLSSMAPDISKAEQKHLLRVLGEHAYKALVCVSWARAQEQAIAMHSPYAKMLTLAQEWTPPVFPVTGADLIDAGIPPGRMMGEVLRQLQAQWEQSDYTLTRAELFDRAAKFSGD